MLSICFLTDDNYATSGGAPSKQGAPESVGVEFLALPHPIGNRRCHAMMNSVPQQRYCSTRA